MGQLTISIAIFNSFLYVYQRVNTMEGSGWFSFVRGWTETWLKHWNLNHQWSHGSLLRYPYHINYIYISYDMGICETISVIISNIQYITLISYAHFVWLISIHFPASLRNKNTARTWHHQARGRLFPCSNAPQADLQLSWRQKIGVQACWEPPWTSVNHEGYWVQNPCSAIVPGDSFHQLVILKVYVGGWGMVNPSFLLVKKLFMKKYEKIKFVQVL